MNTKNAPRKHNNARRSTIVALVTIVIILWLLFGGRSYKKTVDLYIDAALTADAKTMISLIPKELISEAIKSNVIESKKSLIKETQEAADISKQVRDDKYGVRWDYDYKIIDTHKYDADEVETYLYCMYGDDGYRSVKAIRDVSVVVNIEGDERINTSLTLLKIGRKWYIDSIS